MPRNKRTIPATLLAQQIATRTGRPLHQIREDFLNNSGLDGNISETRAEKALNEAGVLNMYGPEWKPLPRPDTIIGIDPGTADIGYAALTLKDGYTIIPDHPNQPNDPRFGRKLIGTIELKDPNNPTQRRPDHYRILHNTHLILEQAEHEFRTIFERIPDHHTAVVTYEDLTPIAARNKAQGNYTALIIGALIRAAAARGYMILQTGIGEARDALGLPSGHGAKSDCARKLASWQGWHTVGEYHPYDALTLAAANAEIFGLGLDDTDPWFSINGHNMHGLGWRYLQGGRKFKQNRTNRPGSPTEWHARYDPGMVRPEWQDIVRDQADAWRSEALANDHRRKTARKAS